MTFEDTYDSAITLHKAGDLGRAEMLYRELLLKAPNHTQTLNMLGSLLFAKGDSDGALTYLTRSLEIEPQQYIAHNNAGVVIREQGALDKAITHFEIATSQNPEYLDATFNLANAYRDLGNLDAAASTYLKVLHLHAGHVPTRVNLGNLYFRQTRYEHAFSVLSEITKIDPDNPNFLNNLGLVQEALKRPSEATESYQHAINKHPDFIDSYNNLGNLYAASCKSNLAIKCFEQAITIAPENAETRYNYGRALQQVGWVDEAISQFKLAVQLCPESSDAHSNLIFTMQYTSSIQPTQISESARRWAASLTSVTPEISLTNEADKPRKLKLGFVSGDLSNHPVGFFLSPVFEHRDPAQFHITCYSNRPNLKEDEKTRHLQLVSDRWRNIFGQSDKVVQAQILEDRIDILFDLSGHTGQNRLAIFARRLAPIQIGWIGSCATTGLQTMDYLFADRAVVPPEDEHLFTETIWRLPKNYLCFDVPDFDVPTIKNEGLHPRPITFGCYNNPTKLSMDTLRTWAEIMSRLPESRIIFRGKMYGDDAVRNRIHNALADVGIAKERTEMRGSLVRDEFLASYNEIDLSLDPFPFGGGVSTAESLWMGVPVITLRSDRWAGRVSESILNAMGRPQWVAKNIHGYIELAVDLANQKNTLRMETDTLRTEFEKSPLCDGWSFTKEIELALRNMWHIWCDEQALLRTKDKQ